MIVAPLRSVPRKSDIPEGVYELGLETVRQGKVAVVTPLGGVNSRGGTQCRALVDLAGTGLTLLDIHGQALNTLRRAFCPGLTVVVTTSHQFHMQIVEALERRNYFEFPDGQFLLAQAESSPLVFEGRPVLDARGMPVYVAGGHGETPRVIEPHYQALARRGVQYLYYFHLTNILDNILDPAFLGSSISRGLGSAVKVVDPQEARSHMGRVGLKAGTMVSIPHHDSRSHSNWSALHGNLGSKFFRLDRFREAAEAQFPLYEVAHYLGARFSGYPETIHKHETSILDVLNFCRPLGVMEVKFQTDYVPYKSADLATLRSALEYRLRLGLGTPLGIREAAA